MDRIDRAILARLQADARISNVALADAVNLTPGPCLRRVQRLEASGVVLGYHARLDPRAIDRGFEVILDIELRHFDRESVDAFEAMLIEYDEVVEAIRLFGSPDYSVRIAVADLEAYERFLSDHVMTLPNVQKTQSRFPMKVLKAAHPFGAALASPGAAPPRAVPAGTTSRRRS